MDRIAMLLALAAAVVSIVGIAIFSHLHLFYGASTTTFLIVPLFAALVTFSTAKFGLKIKQKGQFSRTTFAFIGAGLGVLAVLIVATMTLILFAPPSFYGRAAPTVFSGAFILGGFLGPLIGAIVGYRKLST